MKNTQTSLAIDVSHILAWQGRLTGIERVEHNIIKHYYGQNTARFVTWDPKICNFIVLSNKTVEDLVLLRNSPDNSALVSSNPIKKVFVRVYKLVKKIRYAKSENVTYIPAPNESFLVLAGLWDDNKYIAGLKALKSNDIKIVHVVYDMIPIVQPQYVVEFLPPVFEAYMTAVLPNCAALLAISDSTARDTEQVLSSRNLNVPPIMSFRLGDDLPETGAAHKPQNSEDDFYLSVSTIESRKNHTLLYYAYKLAAEKGIVLPKTIIVGKRGWHTEDFQYVVERDPTVNSKIVIMDSVDDDELCWLYKNCQAVVFPSFYEGWGLSVAEGLYYGKVVFSSNTSSLQEIGGSLVDYFSPNSPDELLELMRSYLDNSHKQATRQAEIRATYKTASWVESAQEFEAKLISLLKNKQIK